MPKDITHLCYEEIKQGKISSKDKALSFDYKTEVNKHGEEERWGEKSKRPCTKKVWGSFGGEKH